MSLQNEYPLVADETTLGESVGFDQLGVEIYSDHISVFKRSFDILTASLLAVLLAPLLVFIFLKIKLSDGGPAIFKQKRIGHNGQEFRCWKFRTMVVNSDIVLKELLENDEIAAAQWEADQKLKNDPRITSMGCFLRKSSLDELPQLWNIIKGDMSLVGPRPIVRSEIKKYGRYFPAYISVAPGVTGLWQVSGRNDTGYDERVRLDVEYVNSMSLAKDFKILLKTIPAVLSTKGAY